MNRQRSERVIAKGLEVALLITIALGGFGQAVLHLWNLLMPELFGLPPLRFWQAVGLMALSGSCSGASAVSG